MRPSDLETQFSLHLDQQRAAELPQWWLDAKTQAWEQFRALPLPTRLDERWRFSKLSPLAAFQNSLLPDATPPTENTGEAAAPQCQLGDAADPDLPGRQRITDEPGHGHCTELPPFERAASLCFHGQTLVHGTNLPEELAERGVLFEPLPEALATHGDLLREYFRKYPAALGSEKFTALNTALTNTGAVLYVPDGVEIDQPLLVEHVLYSEQPQAAFPHTLVILGERARATLIEHFAAALPDAPPENDDGATPPPPPKTDLISGVNDLHAAAGSSLTYIGVQDWSPHALALHSNAIAVGRDARVLSINLHLGGAQVRHESHSRLLAPGAHSDIGSLSIASDTQEFDQRTLQTHAAPHTSSDLLYKNALLGHAHTIFSGLIVVDPDAQQTDAYQSNRNLFLSPDAAADSLPGLEIQANDVRCTHGATSYRIDPEQLYYLHSRGIPTTVANEMLVFGFFEEVLNKLSDQPALRDALTTFIQNKFKES